MESVKIRKTCNDYYSKICRYYVDSNGVFIGLAHYNAKNKKDKRVKQFNPEFTSLVIKTTEIVNAVAVNYYDVGKYPILANIVHDVARLLADHPSFYNRSDCVACCRAIRGLHNRMTDFTGLSIAVIVQCLSAIYLICNKDNGEDISDTDIILYNNNTFEKYQVTHNQ
jgi:hypothetical protein